MSIEDKLRDILNNFHGDPDFLEANVEAVKNAFIEEGYSTFRDRDGMKFMTGQIFYDRFEDIVMNDEDFWHNPKTKDPLALAMNVQNLVLEAAKRAAGLDK